MKKAFLSSFSAHIWRPAAWLHVSGVDVFDFLQGQFTNDLRSIAVQSSLQTGIYGLWLNQKGRVLADSFVLRAGSTAFWIGSYFSSAAVLRERLESYVVADDVTIADETSAWAGVTLCGAGAEAMAEQFGARICFSGRRGARPSVEILFAAEMLPAIEARLDALQLPRWSEEEMTRLRIQAGIAAVPADIGSGDLPNEGGLDADAISYTKGCYLGQEVMARLKSMGRVRRRLLRVTGAGEPPTLPAALFQGGKKIGELRSVAADAGGFAGLAIFNLIGLEAQTGFSFSSDGAEAVRLLEPGDAMRV